MNKLLGAKALKSINASLDALGRAGIGYRGTPPDPRLKVVEVKSSKLVFLTSCPLQSKTDPTTRSCWPPASRSRSPTASPVRPTCAP